MAALSRNTIQPERFPLTEHEARYHSLRVYLQVMQWMGYELEETNWGWTQPEGLPVPTMTDQVK